MLSRDYETRAVLMYVEGITQARKFMSAARGVARLKPVIVLKAGRHAAAAQAAASHTGSMAGSAAVYDAAFARAGLVRVAGLGELFDAAETLGHSITPRNERLAILTNGGGVGIIATDLLIDEGGELAALLPRTIAQLDKQMPRSWSHANPVDIVGDADGARYSAALDALADDRGVGAVLVMNVPTALTSPVEAARAVAGAPGAKVVPLIGCWIGGPDAQDGRKVLHEAGIPAYDTPLRAVRGFMHIVQYRRGQRALQRTPPSVPEARSDTHLVRAIVHGALAEKREILTEPEAKRVLAAYGIPVVPTEVVLDAAEAAAAATRIGFPVAVKVLSREITHKSDVGGVELDLGSEQAVADAVRSMTDKVCTAAPGAQHRRLRGPADDQAAACRRADPGRGRGSGVRADPAGRPWRRGGRGDRRQGARLAAARSGAGRGCAQPHARRSPAARLSRSAAGRARRRRATPWCGCRSSSPTWARSPSSTSIRCWPTPRA